MCSVDRMNDSCWLGCLRPRPIASGYAAAAMAWSIALVADGCGRRHRSGCCHRRCLVDDRRHGPAHRRSTRQHGSRASTGRETRPSLTPPGVPKRPTQRHPLRMQVPAELSLWRVTPEVLRRRSGQGCAVTEDERPGSEQLPASGGRPPARGTRWETLREWGRREPSRRGYLFAAVILGVLAVLSLYRLLTSGPNDGVFSLLGLGGTLLLCGLMFAGYVSRRRRDERDERP
jgi:hypothetical protein